MKLYRVLVSADIDVLTGNGLEYLTDKDGNVIAKFDNGIMVGSQPTIKTSSEDAAQDTVIAA